MSALADLYNSSARPVAIVQGVGYPSQNRSHFRSTDIIGPNVNILTGRSPDQFGIPSDDTYPGEGDAQVQAVKDLYAIGRTGEAGYVQLVGDAVNVNVEEFSSIATEPPGYVSMGSYNLNSGFHRSLQFAAHIILHRDGGGEALTPRVLHFGRGGFDTHSGQDSDGWHSTLLESVSTGIAAFYDDMAGHGMGDAVTLLTVSEFGRTTGENGSEGTDHGAASVLFVVGDAVQGGLHGTYPSLEEGDLDGSGDLVFTTDFRRVYSTILGNWFGVSSSVRDTILGGSFGTLGLF
jgi:uncharacterized protein (DUF1501 family)